MKLKATTNREILERVRARLRTEVMNARRASREHGCSAMVLSALWDDKLDASPAVNRARGFLTAVSLIVETSPNNLVRDLAGDALWVSLDGDEPEWRGDDVPF